MPIDIPTAIAAPGRQRARRHQVGLTADYQITPWGIRCEVVCRTTLSMAIPQTAFATKVALEVALVLAKPSPSGRVGHLVIDASRRHGIGIGLLSNQSGQSEKQYELIFNRKATEKQRCQARAQHPVLVFISDFVLCSFLDGLDAMYYLRKRWHSTKTKSNISMGYC